MKLSKATLQVSIDRIQKLRKRYEDFTLEQEKKKRLHLLSKHSFDEDVYDCLPAAVFLGRKQAKKNTPRSYKNRERKRRKTLSKNARWWTHYNEYLRSEEWREFKRTIMAERGSACERCGISSAQVRLDLHHLTYRNMGHENREDVKLYCYPCHQLMHPGKKF